MAKGDLQYNVGFDVDLAEIQRLQRALATGGVEAAREFNKALGGGPATKQIVFETRVDASGVKRLVAVEKERLSVADAYINKLNQIDKIQAGSATSLRQQVNQAKQARDEIARYQSAANALGIKVREVNGRWAEQNAKVVELEKSLARAEASGFWDRAKTSLNAGGLISFANGLTQITNGLQSASIVVGQITGSINNLVNSLANLQSFALAFEAVGAGASGGSAALTEASRIALNLGTNLTTVREGFQQLTPVVLNSGGTINDVSKIVESLSSRFAAFGISGDRARRVTNGVIQAFAKGKLQAEELTQQISEADPAFKTDFAGALRVTVQELEALVKAGEVTADVLLATLPKLSKASLLYGKLGTSAIDAASALEKGNVTIDQVRNKIQSLTQLNLEAFSKLLQPVVNAFIGIGAAIVDFTTDILKLESLKTIAAGLSGTVQALQRTIGGFLALAKAALTVIEPIAKLANALLSIPGAAEALGFSILGRLIGPLASLKKSFNESQFAAAGFGRVITRATDFGAFATGIQNFIQGNKGAQLELSKTARSAQTLGRAGEFVQGRIAVINRELEGLRTRQANIAGKANLLGSATVANESARIQRAISSLTGELNRYEQILPRVQTQLQTTTARFTALSASGAASQGVLTRTGAVIAGLGRAVVTGIGSAIGVVKGLFAALGPLGIALAGVAVVQAAYANGSKEAAKEIERTKEAIQSYDSLLKEISGSDAQSSQLKGIALAWEELSLDIADSLDYAKDLLNRFANFVQQWSLKIPDFLKDAANAFDNSLIAKIFGLNIAGLEKEADDGDVRLRRFARGFSRTAEGISAESGKINDATAALAKLRAESDGSTEAQARLSAKFRTGLALVQGTQERYNLARKQLEEYNSRLGESPTEEQKGKLAKLKEELRLAGDEMTSAKTKFKEFGDQSGLAAQQIQESIFSIRALGKKLKGLREDLENALPGTKAFSDLAVDIAALEAGLDLLNNRAKDPIELSISIPGRIKERTKELEKLFEQQSKILENFDVNVDAEELEEVQKKIAEIGRDLDNLELLRVKVAVQVTVEDREFAQKIQQIKNNVELTTIRLNTTVDQPQIRQILTNFATLKDTINGLFEQQKTLQIKIADPTLGVSERLQLAREQATTALQIEDATKKAATDLRDSAVTLRRELLAAQTSLAEIGITAREKGFSLGSANTDAGLRSLNLQRESLNAIDAKLKEIATSRGLTFTFRGTADQITRSKIETVNFYKELQQAENNALDLGSGVEKVDRFLAAIEKAGLQAVFDSLATAAESLSTSSGETANKTADISTNLGNAAQQANNIVNAITGLDGLTVNVRVAGISGLWTGGPTQAGQTYQVNELGQEGFLSSAGRLAPINKPKNALWRAPSSGTVIPAHIWSGLDIPTGGVTTNARPMAAGSGGNGLQRVFRAIQSSLAQPRESGQAMHELTAVQARQAIEIGKLSRAVNKLANKDQSVNVSVRGNDATAYLGALNNRI